MPSASVHAAKRINGTKTNPNRSAIATAQPLQLSHAGNTRDQASVPTNSAAANIEHTSSKASPSVDIPRAKSTNCRSTAFAPDESSDSVNVGATNAAAAPRYSATNAPPAIAATRRAIT